MYFSVGRKSWYFSRFFRGNHGDAARAKFATLTGDRLLEAVGLVASCEPAHSDPATARPVARRERLIGLS
eukprot:scaffold77344_cov65-Phaeocystis_antarctica.AAC.1